MIRADNQRSIESKLLIGSTVELMIWTAAFIYLAVIDPFHPPLSFCPSVLIGFGTCPGCGLGRSISLLLHGEIITSFQEHVLGIPTAIVLLYRSVQLTERVYRYYHRINQ